MRKPAKKKAPTKRKGPRRNRASAQKVQGVETAEQACQLRKKGHTYAEIAAMMGLSIEGARKAVFRALAALIDDRDEAAGEYRQLESERLDALWKALWPKMQKGHTQAIEKGVKIIARRAALFGLDAPVKNEHTGKGGGAIQIASYSDLLASASKAK